MKHNPLDDEGLHLAGKDFLDKVLEHIEIERKEAGKDNETSFKVTMGSLYKGEMYKITVESFSSSEIMEKIFDNDNNENERD